MQRRRYGSRALLGAGHETSCSLLLPSFLGESFSASNLADLPCFVILPVDLEIVTLCKEHINRQLWEHVVAKLLMPGALEQSLEAAVVEKSTETRCLVSWMSALTPELFYDPHCLSPIWCDGRESGGFFSGCPYKTCISEIQSLWSVKLSIQHHWPLWKFRV